jgi:phosphoglycerol transferase MdoB-like AlkP superfamily enzyme
MNILSFIANNSVSMAFISMLFSSLYLRILLQMMGQSWIKTIAHTATLVLLPIIVFIITNLISGNIALSLGMVGALSIVRFRNPVRSPLELSVYFGAITMGIAAAVDLKWLAFLVGSVSLVAIALYIINLITTKAGKPFFITSFTEGNSLSTLKVVSTKSLDELNKSKLLISKSSTDNEHVYVLASSNFDSLKQLDIDLPKSAGITATELNQ